MLVRYLYVICSLLIVLLVGGTPASAVTINTNIPGSTAASQDSAQGIVSDLYNFSLMISALLAFGVIVYGGIRYAVSAGNPSGQSEGREWVKAALLGLVLLLGAFIILNTINPDLTTLTLPTLKELPAAPSEGASPPCTLSCPSPQFCTIGSDGSEVCRVFTFTEGLSDSDARSQLLATGVQIKPGVSLSGVRQGVLSETIHVNQACGCGVTVTSGTDGVHAGGVFSHANGYKVDLRITSALDSYVTTNFRNIGTRGDGARLYVNPSGGALWARESDHWDVAVPL